ERGVEVLEPGDVLARLAGPEREAVGRGLLVEGAVGHVRLCDELLRGREDPVLHVEVLDRRLAHRFPPEMWLHAESSPAPNSWSRADRGGCAGLRSVTERTDQRSGHVSAIAACRAAPVGSAASFRRMRLEWHDGALSESAM